MHAQLVHAGFRPLWVNAPFVDLFRFDSVAEALACASLLDLLTEHCERGGGARTHYGRRLLRRRDGVRFPADVYSRPVMWDGAGAAAVSILDASDDEAALADLSSAPGVAWLCMSQSGAGVGRSVRNARGRQVEILLVKKGDGAWSCVAAILHALGCRPTLARSGVQALGALAARPFDLVLLELDLPVMDGFELARRIRALPLPWARLPIAALTPRHGEDVREAVADAGMDAYIPSPVARPHLAAAIAALTRSIEAAELDEIEQEHDRDEPDDRIDGEHAVSALI
jgi:CheY-like chemotaxis protein